MAKRPCIVCGTPADNSRCNRCGTREARGYGPDHIKARAAWEPRVATGQVPCARCNQPIEPHEPWDLGHTDDRTAYSGPEHAGRCNRTAANRARGRGAG